MQNINLTMHLTGLFRSIHILSLVLVDGYALIYLSPFIVVVLLCLFVLFTSSIILVNYFLSAQSSFSHVQEEWKVSCVIFVLISACAHPGYQSLPSLLLHLDLFFYQTWSAILLHAVRFIYTLIIYFEDLGIPLTPSKNKG